MDMDFIFRKKMEEEANKLQAKTLEAMEPYRADIMAAIPPFDIQKVISMLYDFDIAGAMAEISLHHIFDRDFSKTIALLKSEYNPDNFVFAPYRVECNFSENTDYTPNQFNMGANFALAIAHMEKDCEVHTTWKERMEVVRVGIRKCLCEQQLMDQFLGFSFQLIRVFSKMPDDFATAEYEKLMSSIRVGNNAEDLLEYSQKRAGWDLTPQTSLVLGVASMLSSINLGITSPEVLESHVLTWQEAGY